LQIVGILDRLELKVDQLATKAIPPRKQVQEKLEQPPTSRKSTLSSSTQKGLLVYDPIRENSLRLAAGWISRRPLTDGNKIFQWPVVQRVLTAAGETPAKGLMNVLKDGTAWFVRQEQRKHAYPLPEVKPLRTISLPLSQTTEDTPARLIFPELTPNMMKEYAEIYFNTFNVIYPILDYNDFMQQTLPILRKEGFLNADIPSIMALAVFALGKLAFEGVYGEPIWNEGDSASGIRGGTAEKPPALDIFQEVRQRLGFVHSQSSLEVVQILLLTAYVIPLDRLYIRFWN